MANHPDNCACAYCLTPAIAKIVQTIDPAPATLVEVEEAIERSHELMVDARLESEEALRVAIAKAVDEAKTKARGRGLGQ